MRTDAGLSLRALAEAAGVATSTVHRIEQGRLRPTVETLRRLAQAAGARLEIEPRPDHAASVVGLARAIRDADPGDRVDAIRLAAELVGRFDAADRREQARMVTAEPLPTGDDRWDAFVAGLAEWLTVRAGMPTPPWTQAPGRFLDGGWWVTPLASMRAWEYAGTPVSLQRRGVFLHRDSLTNV